MAKSKSFFGLRRGSTKSHTYSVFNGQQVTKDRVDTVKNPRSEAQMLQRMVMKTAGNAYSHMKQIVDHSFEGKTYGLQSMMEFLKVNATNMRKQVVKWQDDPELLYTDFQFSDYKSNKLMGGDYVISKGSASRIAVSPALDKATDHKLGVKLLSATNGVTTANSLLAVLGINVGDLCTVCLLWDDEDYPNFHFDFVRLTALQGGDVALTSENLATYFKVESTLPIDAIAFGTADSPDGISITLTAQERVADSEAYATAIHSVLSDGKWLRSTNSFYTGGGWDADVYINGAFQTYPVGQAYVLNGADF